LKSNVLEAKTRDRSNDKETIKLFWRATMRYKRNVAISALLVTANVILLTVVAPLFVGKTLAALAIPDGEPLRYFVLFIGAALLGIVFNRIGHPYAMAHQAIVARDLTERALTSLLRRSVGFHNDRVGGKLVSDVLDFTAAYLQMASAVFIDALPLATTLLIGSAIIYVESVPLGLFITIMTVTIIGLGIRTSIQMRPRRYRRLEAGKKMTAHLADTITNVQTVKTFGAEDRELREHQKLGQIFADIRVEDWSLISRRGNNRMLILVIFQALFVLITIWLVRHDPALLGVGIFAFTFTITLSNRLFTVNQLIRIIEESLLQASPMTAVISDQPEITDKPGASELRIQGGQVELQNVSFRYHDADRNNYVFTNLNLTIKPGERVGLVGPSGGGKSTLTRLLLRFDDVTDGAILIDGQNIADVTQTSLRQHIAYVPQEPLLFHRSIKENIAYGKPGASLAEIKEAARLAHADEFINKLKDGYDTIVGERGVKLSGGQRQRVAIARAILKNAPILILDEATSALDSESEVLIQEALWELMKGRTAIVIAHRLSTIQKMDRIVVLSEGKIVEEGSHKQLLRKKGLYAKLWSHQSGGFIEE